MITEPAIIAIPTAIIMGKLLLLMVVIVETGSTIKIDSNESP
jgi:hypothetical protein